MEEAQRRSKSAETQNIPCPAAVKEYNRFMGGVDLLDSFIGRHKILLKSKKWYIRIFYYLLDVTVCNAWTLYRFRSVFVLFLLLD